MSADAAADDETRITEITIMPDGQIYVFGMSRQVLELLDQLKFGDRALKQRIEHLRTLLTGGTRSLKAGQECIGRAAAAAGLPRERKAEP